ncbi:MAG: GNAT family protein [Candidatus Woesearchaeota archaeon]|jgi:RimJ/RimL family protein N-acetyltransferase|nr:GNAT family protein [Candidatus Woesearchaeota archaeon]MDP7323306.1 GNAT family protein [Candidatus Woesearchaeota archaeon]
MVTLKGKGFVLRYYRKGDETSLQKNINNKKIYRYTCEIPHPYTFKTAKQWVKDNVVNNKKRKKEKINFVIDQEGKVIGGVGLFDIRPHKAELGYWLGEKYWGQGIVPQAVTLVVDYGFSKIGLSRIYASTMMPNKQSQKVLLKAGFKKEGMMKKYYLKDGKIGNGFLFAKTR